MSSKRYELEYNNGPGKEPTTFYVQETTNRHGSTAYVLTEHPDNKGAHVSSVASKFGDAKINEQLAQDPKFKPESTRLYAERPERGQDGEPRFAEYRAKTTQQQNISEQPNLYEGKASQWQWNDGNRMDKPEAEQRVGASIETSNRFQNKAPEQQNQEFADASMSSTQQADQLREAARQQEATQKHQR